MEAQPAPPVQAPVVPNAPALALPARRRQVIRQNEPLPRGSLDHLELHEENGVVVLRPRSDLPQPILPVLPKDPASPGVSDEEPMEQAGAPDAQPGPAPAPVAVPAAAPAPVEAAVAVPAVPEQAAVPAPGVPPVPAAQPAGAAPAVGVPGAPVALPACDPPQFQSFWFPLASGRLSGPPRMVRIPEGAPGYNRDHPYRMVVPINPPEARIGPPALEAHRRQRRQRELEREAEVNGNPEALENARRRRLQRHADEELEVQRAQVRFMERARVYLREARNRAEVLGRLQENREDRQQRRPPRMNHFENINLALRQLAEPTPAVENNSDTDSSRCATPEETEQQVEQEEDDE